MTDRGAGVRQSGAGRCPRCGAMVDVTANFCPACGLSRSEAAMIQGGSAPAGPPVPEPVEPRPSPLLLPRPEPDRPGVAGFLIWGAGTIALVLIVFVVISTVQRQRTPDDILNDILQRRTINPRATLDAKWWPTDFSIWSGDRSLAWRWEERASGCILDGPCWNVTVISRDGCPRGLYGEVSLMDSAGTAIGYTNDTLSGIARGQRARLVFEASEADAREARLTELDCHG